MDYVIAGNGAAGVAAAQSIKKTDAGARITIITDESYPFYSRVRLMEFLSGEVDEKGLVIFGSRWYEDNGIRLVAGRKITALDITGKRVLLDTAESFSFDRLLLATGARPFVPPFEGVEKAGIFTLRTLDDAKRIISYSRDKDSILLIGGGALGLEAGYAMRKKGLRIKVVEFFDRLLPRQLDPECAVMLRKHLEETGFEFYLGAKVRAVTGDGQMDGVLLEDGRFVPADMALVSSGTVPETSLAEKAGIRIARGIVVDDRLGTSAEDVYSAGDCAEHRGVVYGIWPAAQAQGRVAGENMAGGEALYEGTVPSNVVRVAGLEIFAAGNIDAEGKCECIRAVDEARKVYRKIVIESNRITGCIFLGDTSHKGRILKAIEHKKDIASIKDAIAKWQLEDL